MALAAAALFSTAALADNDSYVLIATGGGNFYWADATKTDSDFGLANVGVLFVFATPQQSPAGKAYTVARGVYSFACGTNTYDVSSAACYDASGKQVDVQDGSQTSPEPARPGGLDYAIETFGCQAARSRRRSTPM